VLDVDERLGLTCWPQKGMKLDSSQGPGESMSDETLAGSIENQRRVGLIVIHGVGEAEPGYCVNTLLDNLSAAAPGYTVSRHCELQYLNDAAPYPISATFPVVRRDASYSDGTKLSAFELYWADIANLKPGRLDTLFGIFRTIFESHHLVDAMLRRGSDYTAQLLRLILWVSGWLMRGPLAALTIATSAICWLFLFGPIADWFDRVPVDVKFLAVQISLFVVALPLLVWTARRKDISWYDTVFWLALVTALLVVLQLQNMLKPLLERVPDLVYQGTAKVDCTNPSTEAACYINGLYRLIIWGWRVWAILLVASVALLVAIAFRSRRAEGRLALAPAATSISIVILQFMLWTTVVVTAIYPMLTRAENISQLKHARAEVSDLLAKQIIPENMIIAKMLRVPDIELEWIERFKFIYGSTVFTIFVFIALAWTIMLIRRIIASAGTADLERAARRVPRLLFNRVLVGWLIVSCLLVIASIFILPRFGSQVPLRAKHFLLPFAAVVAFATPFLLGRRVSNVVQIAGELIDHHYSPRIETAAYCFPSIFRIRKTRPRRARIQGRLVTMLNTMVKNERFDTVIFVAHSQGSVVAYDYLLERGPLYAEIGGRSPRFLSFGSPLGHIYQKYFYEYGSGGVVLDGLRGRLERWVNLYRVDDYIGGCIEEPFGLEIDNRAVTIGGHTNYWSESYLAEALDKLIRSRLTATMPGQMMPEILGLARMPARLAAL
jgi:hypothetical protein